MTESEEHVSVHEPVPHVEDKPSAWHEPELQEVLTRMKERMGLIGGESPASEPEA